MKALERGGDFLLGALFMSLAWSLRGQFGHLKGALIPGAAAAAIVVLFHREELWRKSFGWAVVLSALGFSLGGHLAYGALIEKIMTAASFPIADLLKIFLIGAVWGGLGMTFLGFGLSEKPFTTSDVLLLAFLGLFWFIPLGIFNQETYDLILFGAGLAAIHVYNFSVKKCRTMSLFGAAGFFGFGLGFLLSVILLYAGNHGFFQGQWPWWSLRDQIIGIFGGVATVFALHHSIRLGLSPDRQMITLATQKGGLIFYVVFIPVILTISVLIYWISEQSLRLSPSLALLVFFTLSFLTILFAFFSQIESDFLVERVLDYVLYGSTLFFIWFLSALAIAKQLIPFGWGRWEPAFAIFLMNSLLLSIFLPFKIFRPVKSL